MDANNAMKVKILEELIDSIMSGKLGADEESSEPNEGSPLEELGDKLGGQKEPKAKVEMLAIEADPKKKMIGA